MSFDFTHDGYTYHLDTEGGQVHVRQVAAPMPQPAPQPLEPAQEPIHG